MIDSLSVLAVGLGSCQHLDIVTPTPITTAQTDSKRPLHHKMTVSVSGIFCYSFVQLGKWKFIIQLCIQSTVPTGECYVKSSSN